jgi:hypothetical protein
MMEYAERLASLGVKVFVVVDTLEQAIALDCEITNHSGIKVMLPDFLPGLDWMTLRVDGLDQDHVVLVDHHVIERRFGRLLRESFRYNYTVPSVEEDLQELPNCDQRQALAEDWWNRQQYAGGRIVGDTPSI